ncbi:MAG TPA: hypothetical protein VK501_21065 [Baekduia sp.]|uniref:hypothetical protein n=1 Tax=Baekduia sp. TaxID=2600305 RepID=UPI002D0462D8|nr:hypothetical protein [Baekduia sp.]HMJ36407.1 hypothetical protein [Baekduia sp.]
MPSLRRRPRGGAEAGSVAGAAVAPEVPWALGPLLRDGPTPLVERAAGGERLDVAVVLGTGQAEARDAGIPGELVGALGAAGIDVRIVGQDEAAQAADADVVLAAGWPAAPAVLTLHGVRARAVLATPAPPVLGELGWATGLSVFGPAWMGGALPGGADAAYGAMPVHRREDLVLVHSEEPFGLLAAAELHARRDDLTFAVSGARRDLDLPFEYLAVEPGGEALAHAFASATVAFAPPVRGWRPAAVAMLVCGQAVVAPGDGAGRSALGPTASLATSPLEAADLAEVLVADLELRATRARAGFARFSGGWTATATALAAALRALP